MCAVAEGDRLRIDYCPKAGVTLFFKPAGDMRVEETFDERNVWEHREMR